MNAPFKQRFLGTLIGAACWMFCPTAHGVTVLVRGMEEPVRGYLVEEDARGVTLNVPAANGTLQKQFIPASKIEILQKPVSPERLAGLQPDEPKEYRDYAEELAEKRVDPEARDTSLRLYLIAAYLDPKSLGESSLLGMTALARSEAEERRFRALAFLLDPEHDRSILRRKTEAASASPEGRNELLDRLVLRALEELRTGNYHQAGTLLRRPGVDQHLAHYDPEAWELFMKLTAGRSRRSPPPTSDVVTRIVRIEVKILGGEEKDPALSTPESSASSGWAKLDNRALAATAPSLTLETITEFNPAECVYRDGRWTTPE